MRMSIKILFISSILVFTASCQDKLDTSSNLAKEQSIKQMMVGIYPENQARFHQALETIYLVDQRFHTDISIAEANALTDQKLKDKTVVEILHISFASKKIDLDNIPKRSDNLADHSIANNSTITTDLVKTGFISN